MTKIKVKAKAKPVAKTESLVKYFPQEQLTITKKQIKDVVHKTESNELHTAFRKAKAFYLLLEEAVKNEFSKRAKRNPITTDEGTVSLVSTSKFSCDNEKVIKFLKKNKISLEKFFDFEYVVITNDKKVLSELVRKGYVARIEKFKTAKAEKIAEEYPAILKLLEETTSTYIKGL